MPRNLNSLLLLPFAFYPTCSTKLGDNFNPKVKPQALFTCSSRAECIHVTSSFGFIPQKGIAKFTFPGPKGLAVREPYRKMTYYMKE
jgi:hypothetical protein